MAIFGGQIVFIPLLLLTVIAILIQSAYSKKLIWLTSKVVLFLSAIIILNWLLTSFGDYFIEYPTYIFRVIVVNLVIFSLINSGSSLSYRSYTWVFKLITIHALLNFIISIIFSNQFIPIETSQGFKTSTILFLFFKASFITFKGIEVFRNQGIFWEPGILSLILNLYLFINLIIEKNRNSKITLLIFFLIVTTFSTTGLVLMLFQIAIYFINSKFSLSKVLLATLGFISLLPLTIENIKEKASGAGEMSYLLRNYDAMISIDVIMKNPTFGIGLSEDKYKNEQKKYTLFQSLDLEEGRGNTNSILTIFVAFGVPLGILILTALYRQRFFIENSILAFIIFVIFLASEPLIYSAFFIMVLSTSFYKEDFRIRKIPKLKEN